MHARRPADGRDAHAPRHPRQRPSDAPSRPLPSVLAMKCLQEPRCWQNCRPRSPDQSRPDPSPPRAPRRCWYAPPRNCPSARVGRPTSGPWVISVACGQFAISASKFGVLASSGGIALALAHAGPSHQECTERRVCLRTCHDLSLLCGGFTPGSGNGQPPRETVPCRPATKRPTSARKWTRPAAESFADQAVFRSVINPFRSPLRRSSIEPISVRSDASMFTPSMMMLKNRSRPDLFDTCQRRSNGDSPCR